MGTENLSVFLLGFSLSGGIYTWLICVTGTPWMRSYTADQCKIFPPDLAGALAQSLPASFMFLAWTCCFTMDFCTQETIFTWFEQILHMKNLLTINMLFLANALDESTVRGVLSIKFENELVSFQSGCPVSITGLGISTQYCIACGIWEYLKETKVQLQLPRYSYIFFKKVDIIFHNCQVK